MTKKFEQVLKSLGLKSDGIGLSTKGLPEGLFQRLLTRPEYHDTLIDNMRKLTYDFPIWTKNLILLKKDNL